jgi:hypothetical protein
MIIHGQKKLEKELGWREILRGIGLNQSKLVKLTHQVKKITSKNICYHCQAKLSNKLQVYFPTEEKLEE